MALHVALMHRTSYEYDRPVQLGPQTIRLRPAPHSRTPILSYSLGIEPAGHFVNWQQDPQGNFLARDRLPRARHPFQSSRWTCWPTWPPSTRSTSSSSRTPSTVPFAVRSRSSEAELAAVPAAPIPPGPLLTELMAADPSRTASRPWTTWSKINNAVRDRIGYIVRMEPGVWTPEQTLEQEAKGSCRDSAWVLVQALRNLGFAARFVSGYLIQLKPDIAAIEGPAGASERFHRPARLGRNLPARRRLGRAGRHQRTADRRGPHPARCHPGTRCPPRRSRASVEAGEDRPSASK